MEGIQAINSQLFDSLQESPGQTESIDDTTPSQEARNLLEERQQNVNVQAGISALQQSLESDPVAQFISYLA